MTNAEKYKEKIENYKGDFCENFVQPTILKRDTCEGMGCHQCRMLQMMWLMDEYKEPETDWSKVAVDTPILVKDHENEDWYKRHFAKYEDGKVYAWNDGYTSWSKEYIGDGMVDWKYAKLAKEDDE